MLNSFGDKIPPYITPILMFNSSSLICIAVQAYNHFIVFMISMEYPFLYSSLKMYLCVTVSNAFYISRCMVAMILLLNQLESFQYCIFCYSFKRFSSHPKPLLNPIQFLLFFIILPGIISSFSIFLLIMCSNNLYMVLVIVIGLVLTNYWYYPSSL